ncbi:MAG: peptidoglycan recognition protein family protein [Pseudomonadales bacterium]|nr:peptidoglycan recognition protein family protein [Pseudomonadales bacterium]
METTSVTITFEMVFTALTVAAGFSILVERIVEALKHVVDSGNVVSNKTQTDKLKQVNEAAKITFDTIKQILSDKDRSPKNIAAAIETAVADRQKDQDNARTPTPSANAELDEAAEEMSFEAHSPITIKQLKPVNEAEQDRRKMQLFYLFSSIAIGIAIATSMDLHLLSLLFLKADVISSNDPWLQFQLFLDKIITGIFIAGGSQPIHILIRFITTRRVPEALLEPLEDESQETKIRAQQAAPPQTEPAVNIALTSPVITSPTLASATTSTPLTTVATASPAVNTPLQDSVSWLPIEYHGGVKPDSLQHRNLRAGNPNRIIFHHTAMSSDLGFQAVVDEFLVNKGWSTGYHCVIMPNGAIKPFCRWDRVGNHTKGLNNRSLGIAFHGNFHTQANDRFSNANGLFGIQTPTHEQLVSGARIIALWTHIYEEIELNFNQHILPHREAKPGHTVCPGSNFPVEELQELISSFFYGWQASGIASEQIALFKNNPYLYLREAQ